MKVARIAAAPMLRRIGRRLPISAQVKPKKASTAMAIEISPGTLPVIAKPAINASRIT